MVHTLKEEDLKKDGAFNAKPRKFVVWLFVVSSTIMFGGLTSYYIVFAGSKGKGHGLVLPDVFMYSTAILIASSICLFMASKALKNGKYQEPEILSMGHLGAWGLFLVICRLMPGQLYSGLELLL